jgi:carboxymethylenebutenolidase
MCFDSDSLPPIPVLSGAAISHEEFVLAAEDGNRFAAFRAFPEEPADVGVVILPDVRGLYRFYEELALRFAERGYNAIAFDYFGRTAGVGTRGDDFEYGPHVDQTKPGTVQEDVGACVNQMRALESRAIFTVGFCFGGRHSWFAAASRHGLAGAVGFYGYPTERNGVLGPAERAADMECPILALQAGADPNITALDNDAFEAALRKAGVQHEIVTYEGAPHSFFDRKQEEFADASEDAWRRVLEFIERYSAAS